MYNLLPLYGKLIFVYLHNFYNTIYLYTFIFLGPKSHLRKTAKKHPISRKTIQKFHESTIWQMENELYSFVAREFVFAYTKQFPNTSSGLPSMGKYLKLGRDIPPPSFRYEKIYPKPQQQQKNKKKH